MSPFKNLVKRALCHATPPRAIREINVREAYSLWAPTYAAETVTSFLDNELAQQMMQGLPQARLLDAGCGIGRRIQSIPGAIGIDQSPEMVAASGASNIVAGDIRYMPFDSGYFDMIWCRLVLGHLPDPLVALRELARVCMPGGHIFLTDFHPEAAAAGHRRTLTDRAGTVHAIEHHVHTNLVELAAEAGLELIEHRDAAVGPSVRSFYVRGIGINAYRRDLGLKLVNAFLFRRSARGQTGYPAQCDDNCLTSA